MGILCTTGIEGDFRLVEAKLVKLCTGASAAHKVGKTTVCMYTGAIKRWFFDDTKVTYQSPARFPGRS